jgi:hypothetical protein
MYHGQHLLKKGGGALSRRDVKNAIAMPLKAYSIEQQTGEAILCGS